MTIAQTIVIPGLKPELWVHRSHMRRAEARINERGAGVDEDGAPAAMEWGGEG